MQVIKALTEKEEKQLLRTIAEIKGFKAERDHIICVLGFNAGLRLSELIGLNVGDVRNKERLYLRPEICKRARPRLIPLNTRVQRAIRNYIKAKLLNKESINDDAPLFVSRNGNRLSKRSLQEMFENWCVRAKLSEHGEKSLYTVHSMRHSFAKRLVQRGVNLEVVQKLLGHASLSSTGIYVEASIEELEEAVSLR